MGLNKRVFLHEAEAAADGGAAASAEQNLILHLDANDVDSYDGDGSVWYDISEHDVTVPLTDKSDNLKFELNFSDPDSYSGTGTTFNDISGNDVTITSANVTASDFDIDNGGYFNVQQGSEKWTIPHSDDTHVTSTNGFTYEFWLYFDQTGNDTFQFYLKGSSNIAYDVHFDLHEGNGWTLRTSGLDTFSHNADKLFGQWVHVAFSYSSKTNPTQKLYINGELKKTSSITGTVPSTSSYETRIGTTADNANDLYGRLGCVRLYNTELSASDVAQNYRHGRDYIYTDLVATREGFTEGTVTSGFEMELKANDYSGSGNWLDSTSNDNDGTITGATYVDDNVTDYFDFDGSGDKIVVSNFTELNSGARSYEFWCSPDSYTSLDHLVGRYGSASTDRDFFIRQANSSGGCEVGIYTSGGSVAANFTETVFTTYGIWYHIVLTVEGDSTGDNVKLYVNGEQKGTTRTLSGARNTSTTIDLYFGQLEGFSNQYEWNGKLAQARIYQSELSSSEVKANYDATKGLYENADLRLNLAASTHANPTIGTVTSGAEIELDANDYSGSGNWSNTGDTSGMDGTITGATYNDDNSSDYFDFDGDDKVTISNNSILNSSARSWEFWVWFDSVSQLFFGGQYSVTNATNSVMFRLRGSSPYNTIRAQVYDGSGSGSEPTGTKTITNNRWYHIVFVSDNSDNSFKSYIDGVLDINTTLSFDINTSNADDFVLGRGGAGFGTTPLNGRIGQFRFYDTALTAAQVSTNYDATKEQYIFRLTDSTGYSNAPQLVQSGTASFDRELGDWIDFGGGYFFDDNYTEKFEDSSGNTTVEFWYNFDSLSTQNAIIQFRTATASRWHIGTYNSELLSYYYGATGIQDLDVTLSGTLGISSTGRWYHIAVVKTAANQKVYVDGVLKTTHVDAVNAAANTITGIRIGDVHHISGYGSDGKLGQLRVYKDALTADQVMQNYLFTKNDYPNTNHGTISGATWDSSGYFDFERSSSNNVTISDSSSLDISGDITLLAWVNEESVANYGRLFWKSGAYHLYRGTNGWTFLLGSTSLNHNSDIPSTGTWYHIAATYDGVNQKLYINGDLKDTESMSGSIPTNSNSLYIAGDTTNRYFDGKIGAAKIYSKALTAEELLADYNATKSTYGL